MELDIGRQRERSAEEGVVGRKDNGASASPWSGGQASNEAEAARRASNSRRFSAARLLSEDMAEIVRAVAVRAVQSSAWRRRDARDHLRTRQDRRRST